jgi:hypothetical protein
MALAFVTGWRGRVTAVSCGAASVPGLHEVPDELTAWRHEARRGRADDQSSRRRTGQIHDVDICRGLGGAADRNVPARYELGGSSDVRPGASVDEGACVKRVAVLREVPLHRVVRRLSVTSSQVERDNPRAAYRWIVRYSGSWPNVRRNTGSYRHLVPPAQPLDSSYLTGWVATVADVNRVGLAIPLLVSAPRVP